MPRPNKGRTRDEGKRIEVRLSKDERADLDRAAELLNRDLSGWVRETMLREARLVLRKWPPGDD